MWTTSTRRRGPGARARRPIGAGPRTHRLTVRQAFEVERASLMALPEPTIPWHERLEVQVGKTPYVRFDLNDYSIPHTHVRRTLTVLATPDRVRVLDGATVLASHRRSYDRARRSSSRPTSRRWWSTSAGARQHRATDRLAQAVPAVAELLQRAAARGYNLGSITAGAVQAAGRYGAQPLQAAITEALAHDVPHPNAVRLALERARESRHENPPVWRPTVRARALAGRDGAPSRTGLL